MPQITLECSDNIIEKNFSNLLLEIHQLLTEMLHTQISSCKSRVIRHQDYVVAEGAADNAFVHLSIGVLSGRSTDLLNTVAAAIMEKLKITFKQSLAQLNLQISIAIQDLPPVYFKYVT